MFRTMTTFPPTVWLIIIATMLSRFTFFMVWPYLAVILHKDHGLSPAQIGAFLSTAGVTGSLVGLYVGYLSDRFGRRRVIVAGLALSVVSVAALGLTQSLGVMLLGMMGKSLSGAAIEHPGRALMTDVLADRDAKDLALHLRYYALNVGAAFGPLAGVAWGLTGHQSTFLIVAGVMSGYLLAALFVFFRADPPRMTAGGTKFSFRAVTGVLSSDRVLLVFVLGMFLGNLAYCQIDAGLVQYLQMSSLIDVTQFYPYVTMVNGVTIIILQFPLLALMRPLAPFLRALIGVGLMAVAFAVFAVVPATSARAILFAVFVLSVGEVILFPTLNMIVDRLAPPDLKGSYFGATSLAGFGWSFGPLVGGALLSMGGGPLLWWSMVGLMGAAALAYMQARRGQGGAGQLA